ncbi:prolyl-tRNA synthetase [Aspergillus sclerotiicarbonarius CBS 121057]|uniref:proline--tRNA ligase n=1 Tax=Aspergillus sclerotiicarbonarius (strain CBS 121057 / IBT 28362) TaxID=1448318 RepID=A0A319DWH1_ASPSB|nr:prolyl-tRNA synthetase [Aspergillus sclerotiicarbonarius CBS 121057]
MGDYHAVIGDLQAVHHAFDNSQQTEKAPSAALNGIDTTKEDDFPRWYQQILLKGEMIDYYDVSGCYVLRPGSWEIWEIMQEWFNKEIKKMGVRNCSFPMFVTEEVLRKEQSHIEGFSAEVAWVTQSGTSTLEKKIAIRPTSETIIYPYLANWIRSYRELPLRLNQWNSVVRWEFKNPQPFLRSREFYWQEGHTAHLTSEGAEKEVHQILDLYCQIYRDFLAIPVVPGRKTDKEKFAGAEYTTTVEAYIPATGRAIQGATSHGLGQNFSKMFNISVEDPKLDGTGDSSQRLFLWQNSWAYSTRVIGVMAMVHGDNKGLVVPPRVAPIQVVIVPVGITAQVPEERTDIHEYIKTMQETLESDGIRVEADLREEHTPGWKFNHWELKGIPLRLEVGPRELNESCISTSRRDTREKGRIELARLSVDVRAVLETIQASMYVRALEQYRNNVKVITKWEQFTAALDRKHLCLIPFCTREDCEERIRRLSERTADPSMRNDARAPSMGAKSLCIPFQQPSELQGTNTKCLAEGCELMAEKWCLFGRSY